MTANTELILVIRRPEADRSVKVRFPTDAEWATRARARKLVVKHLGRGTSESTIPNAEAADSALFDAIAPTENDLDAAEKQRVVSELATAEVVDVVPDGRGYIVTLRTIGSDETDHHVRMPTQAQVSEYRRGFVRVLDLPHSKQEIRTDIEPAGRLYDALCDQRHVPLIHKFAVVQGVLQALESIELEPSPKA